MSIKSDVLPCLEGSIGVITLASPATLNALSETMIDQIQTLLDAWAEDDRICLVLIHGEGEKAFCAGGDIRKLHAAMTTEPDPAVPTRYFSKEYRMDYTLHRFPKPVIGWAHRVVMGGGVGLLSACRYRLVTPDLMMAMPEISIGLFPDVGAGWFLNRLPEGLGLFLGLTGARLNVSDALRVGLADIAVEPDQLPDLLEQIQASRWSGNIATDDNRLHRLLSRLESPAPDSLPESQLARHERTIAALCQEGELTGIVDKLLAAPEEGDWWKTAINNLRDGCPVTAWLVHEQLSRARQLTLKEIFRMELVMAVRCCQHPDFAEGVRSRLIERDQSPKWQHASVDEVPWETVEHHFEAPWDEDQHPLADL